MDADARARVARVRDHALGLPGRGVHRSTAGAAAARPVLGGVRGPAQPGPAADHRGVVGDGRGQYGGHARVARQSAVLGAGRRRARDRARAVAVAAGPRVAGDGPGRPAQPQQRERAELDGAEHDPGDRARDRRPDDHRAGRTGRAVGVDVLVRRLAGRVAAVARVRPGGRRAHRVGGPDGHQRAPGDRPEPAGVDRPAGHAGREHDALAGGAVLHAGVRAGIPRAGRGRPSAGCSPVPASAA
ncbi:hypothetical protein JOF29_002068 [Kribbella aluminosa]|uniref:Uncharacterized protein n=1 Tax=Kribbella aluminosa TaxID=416017 RepID=A0ABS4UH83_9ACTN|nr:hypothetical protein [Kribbella aluminosa]